jgi:SAM-dependent methyltransferase
MAKCLSCGSVEHRPLFSMKGYDLVCCESCSLAFIANPPTDAELSLLYSASGCEYHADLQNPSSPAWRRIARIAQRHLRFVENALGKDVKRGASLVDVGCSTGQFLALAKAGGFAAHGVEFSQESADFAASFAGTAIDLGTIRDCTLQAGSVDVLTMFDVIEHVRDPIADMQHAWDLLRPGGWLVMSTPNIDGLFPRASYPLANALGYWPHPEPPHHLYQFSVRSLTDMVRKAGFVPGRVEHCAIDLDYTFGTLATLRTSPKRAAYALAFAPLAWLGPKIGMGDWFYIAAQKPVDAATTPAPVPMAAAA